MPCVHGASHFDQDIALGLGTIKEWDTCNPREKQCKESGQFGRGRQGRLWQGSST